MNLLVDSWIPIQKEGVARYATLREVMCTDGGDEICLPRDDMELAALQLIICLAQVLFPVADQAALRARIKTPLGEAEYQQAIAPFQAWFDLDHADTPFMQTRGVKAAEPTPIQKLFIGLPEGNNHAFFNAEGELSAVCGGCAAIALFNQANNCPSFGGGFKGGLRGSAPITTLIDAPTLRQRIWENVLPLNEIGQLLPDYVPNEQDCPVWVEPLRAGKRYATATLGLLRGLFWQPAHVELLPTEGGQCDHCGGVVERRYADFNKAKFTYELEGIWPHPHSPRQWQDKKGERLVRFASFTTTAPAWTQLTQFMLAREERKEGHVPAPVVSSRRKRRSGERLQLLVGGYRNNKASVTERRHELFSFAPGWEDGHEQLADWVDLGLSMARLLRGSLYWAAKGQKDQFKGLGVPVHEAATQTFYQRSEERIHQGLREMDYDTYQAQRRQFASELASLARELYAEAVAPYQHDPELIHAIAAGRARLNKELKLLME